MQNNANETERAFADEVGGGPEEEALGGVGEMLVTPELGVATAGLVVEDPLVCEVDPDVVPDVAGAGGAGVGAGAGEEPVVDTGDAAGGLPVVEVDVVVTETEVAACEGTGLAPLAPEVPTG